MALVVLIPVVAVIGLGAYGESLGGSASSVGESGSELRVSPGRGIPGEPVRLEGERWPPRSRVDLFINRMDAAERSTRLSIAKAITSRSGTFIVDAVVPAALIGPQTESVRFEAEAVRSRAEVLAASSVMFEIEPYENELNVEVFDTRSGDLLPDVKVQLLDFRGSVASEGMTGTDGSVRFTNVNPGEMAVHARKLDYLRANLDLRIPVSGATTARLGLTGDPQRRLFVPFTESGGTGTLRIAGVDRASGMRSDLAVDLPRTASGDVPAGFFMNFFFLVPEDSRPSNGADRSSAEQFDTALTFFRNVGIGFSRRNFRYPPYAWYSGRSSTGEVLLMVESPGKVALFDLIAVDEDTRKFRVLTRYLSLYDVPPLVSPAGAQYFYVDRYKRKVEVVDIRTGEVATIVSGLPKDVFRVAADPSGQIVYVVTLTGGIYRVDLVEEHVVGPIAEAPGATWLAVSGDGASLYVVGVGLNVLTVVGLDDPYPVRLAPLDQSAEWVWADPQGPYIYAGWSIRPVVTLIDSETLEVAGLLDFRADFDEQASGG
ncbi:MAG: hypothetical protein OXG46_03785 [Chloroflexi bacterium]|nr:hypothetical protein [Chloroflexota bacterium]MCY3938719.1 hypothetical protein [Chloroflexota bacterium]